MPNFRAYFLRGLMAFTLVAVACNADVGDDRGSRLDVNDGPSNGPADAVSNPDGRGDAETDGRDDISQSEPTDDIDEALDVSAQDGRTINPSGDSVDEDASTDAVQDVVQETITFGFPVFTQAERDSWRDDSAQYERLANSWAGRVTREHTEWGDQISQAKLGDFKDESVYIKVQALLWAADQMPERHAKLVAMFQALGRVESFEEDAGEQYRLVAGWSCTNLAQAGALADYQGAEFRSFLTEVCYPLLDWPLGPNWHASFADSRLAIAAYIGDETLWQDARDYFHVRIAQSFYHSAYDDGQIVPLLNDAGHPHVSITMDHWGRAVGAAQIHEDFTPVDPAQFPDGTNGERMRDLAHVSMSMGAWMHAVRTLNAQNDPPEPHALARLHAGYAHHGSRVLTYLSTGELPEPRPTRGDGGSALYQGWLGARAIYKDQTPASVLTLCDLPDVLNFAPAGANHMVAEAFTDL